MKHDAVLIISADKRMFDDRNKLYCLDWCSFNIKGYARSFFDKFGWYYKNGKILDEVVKIQ